MMISTDVKPSVSLCKAILLILQSPNTYIIYESPLKIRHQLHL